MVALHIPNIASVRSKHPEGELSTAESKSNKAKKVLVLAGKATPKVIREDKLCEELKTKQ